MEQQMSRPNVYWTQKLSNGFWSPVVSCTPGQWTEVRKWLRRQRVEYRVKICGMVYVSRYEEPEGDFPVKQQLSMKEEMYGHIAD